MIIFGTSWDAPVCDGQTPVPAPVGTPCGTCSVPIIATDRGVIMPVWGGPAGFSLVIAGTPAIPVHRECQLAEVIGHLVGVCRCTGWAISDRATGLEVARRVDAEPRPVTHVRRRSGITLRRSGS